MAGKLIYATITSLDGYTTDADGAFDWARPNEEVFAFVNELERPVRTYLYGRRMYETMVYWETLSDDDLADAPESMREFTQIWRSADKVVFSSTLAEASSERTRIVPRFDPAEVARLKESATTDLSIGGPEIAGVAWAAGLVDEVHLFVTPVTVGGGQSAVAPGLRSSLELVGLDRLGDVVHLHYAVSGAGA